MRKIITITLVVVLGLCLATTAFADKATKGEIIAKVKEAATIITNKGQDAAFKEINNKKGSLCGRTPMYLSSTSREPCSLVPSGSRA